MKLATLFSLVTLLKSSGAFTAPVTSCFRASSVVSRSMATTNSKSAADQAADLKAQAAAMRLEAAKMDAALTLKKIASVERRLNDVKWLDKHRDQEEMLMKQLQDLNRKVLGQTAAAAVPAKVNNKQAETEKVAAAAVTTTTTVSQQDNNNRRTFEDTESTLLDMNDEARIKENPLEGFPLADLDLFLPAALTIEAAMPNATVAEQMVKFREDPNLQERFQQKIQELVLDPMADMQKLEDLRDEYLSSSSSGEKDTLKVQIRRLEAAAEKPYSVSDSFYRGTKPMSQDELELRIENLKKLPKLLQGLYMRRNGVSDDMDLELGILMEHYDEQIQLLDQVRFIDPMPNMDRMDAIRGYESLPAIVQEYFAKSMGLEAGASTEDVTNAMTKGGAFVSKTPMRIMESALGGYGLESRPEYNDIEFIERSQYIEELIPSITDMETVLPAQEQIDFFVNKILDSKTYKLRSKPERVFGGYYVRGYNAMKGEDANNKLVTKLNEKIAASELAGKVQFFFIPDPKALTDEEIDMAGEAEAVLLVTGVDPAILYRQANFLKKTGISAAGLLSLLIFALGTCELNDIATSRIEDALKAENLEELMRLTSSAVPVGLSLAAIQLAHEGAHRLVAWKDEVRFFKVYSCAASEAGTDTVIV